MLKLDIIVKTFLVSSRPHKLIDSTGLSNEVDAHWSVAKNFDLNLRPGKNKGSLPSDSARIKRLSK